MADDGAMDVSLADDKAGLGRPRDRVHHTVTACVRCRQVRLTQAFTFER